MHIIWRNGSRKMQAKCTDLHVKVQNLGGGYLPVPPCWLQSSSQCLLAVDATASSLSRIRDVNTHDYRLVFTLYLRRTDDIVFICGKMQLIHKIGDYRQSVTEVLDCVEKQRHDRYDVTSVETLQLQCHPSLVIDWSTRPDTPPAASYKLSIR